MSTTSTPASKHNISPYAQALACDHYYHLGLDTDMDLQALFGDVKYFVMMGSPTRAETFAEGRTDGALTPWYTEEDKINFIHKMHDAGVRNIEMESVALMGFCQRAKIPAACVCVTLVNRLEGDQITSTKRQLAKFNEYSIRVVSNFIATTEAKTTAH
ncbi:Uridine phosphorylase 2 [Perkinsus olseni]|uniref:Uridine phosphorylase 2 n=1 Tax=Perkinsus olseni TaxID=32597 RepID=A0A7J6MPF4_PEROL|nr:Uridine phosphorylase 2 [Perkinsus olseni]